MVEIKIGVFWSGDMYALQMLYITIVIEAKKRVHDEEQLKKVIL